MGPERRGRTVHGRLEVNPSGEEPTDRPRQKNAGLWEPYDGRLSRTVLREREGEVPSRHSPGSLSVESRAACIRTSLALCGDRSAQKRTPKSLPASDSSVSTTSRTWCSIENPSGNSPGVASEFNVTMYWNPSSVAE